VVSIYINTCPSALPLDYSVQGMVLFVHVELALPGSVVVVVVIDEVGSSNNGTGDGGSTDSRVGWAYVRCCRPALACVSC
jgi:hypothetical protein